MSFLVNTLKKRVNDWIKEAALNQQIPQKRRPHWAALLWLIELIIHCSFNLLLNFVQFFRVACCCDEHRNNQRELKIFHDY
jgi:hypothetical protein